MSSTRKNIISDPTKIDLMKGLQAFANVFTLPSLLIIAAVDYAAAATSYFIGLSVATAVFTAIGIAIMEYKLNTSPDRSRHTFGNKTSKSLIDVIGSGILAGAIVFVPGNFFGIILMTIMGLVKIKKLF